MKDTYGYSHNITLVGWRIKMTFKQRARLLSVSEHFHAIAQDPLLQEDHEGLTINCRRHAQLGTPSDTLQRRGASNVELQVACSHIFTPIRSHFGGAHLDGFRLTFRASNVALCCASFARFHVGEYVLHASIHGEHDCSVSLVDVVMQNQTGTTRPKRTSHAGTLVPGTSRTETYIR
jgi:hypothetical protein